MNIENIAAFIYEAARIEALYANRRIVPEPWESREHDFKDQFCGVVGRYIEMDDLPTPADAHDSWVKAYEANGWKYGKVRDVEKREHPDMVPFCDLPKDERDKDEIFLSLVAIGKAIAHTWPE